MHIRSLFLSLAVAASALAADQAPLTVDLQVETIVVGGLQPGGTVSVLLVARDESGPWPEVTRRHEQLADDDRDGVVRLSAAVPPRATVIVAVDHADGRFATFPALSQIPVLPVPPDGLTVDGHGRPIRFAPILSHAWALLIRPNVGAWTLAVSEGGADDADARVDHRATIAFERMRARAGGKGPDHLLPRDVLVLIDTSTLRLLIMQRQPEP
jgi:hypothetical protein